MGTTVAGAIESVMVDRAPEGRGRMTLNQVATEMGLDLARVEAYLHGAVPKAGRHAQAVKKWLETDVVGYGILLAASYQLKEE